jgi:steroid delta-isomerase-like uncharacterized protein
LINSSDAINPFIGSNPLSGARCFYYIAGRVSCALYKKEVIIVSTIDLSKVYAGYIECLNAQNWSALGNFVHEDVYHNDRPFGVSGYREMLENDFRQIPDLQFNVLLLVADSTTVACRLGFDCSPKGTFLGLPVNGKTVRFTENVFYQFREGKIVRVWSIVDKAAIEAQL